MNKSEIKEKVSIITNDLISIRRHLHSNPELSFEEKKTAQYISNMLTEWNISHETGIGGYGIVGLIKGKNPDSKVLALRADMDALPIDEQNTVDYKSLNDGVMHACGHDVHMTCLLGAVKILKDNSSSFNGTIKFIFQPAEETLPGGALAMINEGVLENPKVDMILGLHVFPEMEVGKAGIKPGPYMASTDEINLTITGRGGHAAIPSSFDDTVYSAAEIIVNIKRAVEDQAPEGFPTVLSFGKIVANGAYNVIPPEVTIRGTFRTFNEDWRKTVHAIIKDISAHTALKHSTKCEVFINPGYPVLENEDDLSRKFKIFSAEMIGKENVIDLDWRTTGEDFARFTQLIPGCFFRLGVANHEKGIKSNLHTPTFDIDEKSIEIGTGLIIWNALRVLSD